ncbi:GAF domain-containing protein [Nostoc sp. FACHB-280]|uniref:GAF domain-containing protein n=1 Tax=Nostoc sp. FACHB-280 TaxID=2692839 RepID=UPI00168B1AC5|nr:GAF domain-containing protein [Nostoc sp. FACHB-280]MBD2498912.1 GAF domain-containing protein [Nostoc sp. FACHB-280]
MKNQAKEIRLLFLNLSNENNKYQKELEDTLRHIQSIPEIEIEETNSLLTAKDKLVSINASNLLWDIFLVWIDDNNSHIWNDLANFKYEHKHLEYLGIITVFNFNEPINKKARDAMLKGIYVFACPFNPSVLEAYIQSIGLEMKNAKSILKFKKDFLQDKDFDKIVENLFLELNTNPIIGYDRATISLIDNKTGERHLLKYDAFHVNPDRQLLKIINEDRLIKNVNEKGVIIIDDLKHLRETNPNKLYELGWEDKDATNDINSWVGLAAKRQDKTIAIITLDHKTPGHYARYKDKLIKFLQGYGEILADTIVDFLQERNARVVKEITREIGDDLKSEALMRQILIKLRDELKCDNCTYFKVSSPIDVNEIFLEEWVGANDSNNFEEVPRRIKRIFEKGKGIVGCVLKDGKSRIIPNALENEEFQPNFRFPGSNLSMLAVPVIPYIDENDVNQSNRIIGVINCYKNKKDHFTIYDRELVETVAQSTATVIERTMTLEYSNDISSKMNELVLNKNKANLLKKICEHALKVTSARAAVIHRLEYSMTLPNGEEIYRVKGETYTFPEDIKQQFPRLDGSGTTDVVIQEKKTMEFSEKFENFKYVSKELKDLGIKYQIVVPLMIKNELEQQRIVGALYLNKYSEIPFSDVEKFALELFANQAASTIYHQEFLAEKLTWTKANTDLATAIEAIATRNDPDLLLKDIVRYAYSLVDASFSYLALLNEYQKFDYKAAWPEYILTELNHRTKKIFKDESDEKKIKIGITKLAAEKKETILIADLQEEKAKNSEYWQQYIQFKEETRSELVVPIIVIDKVIGVINLEHKDPYAFTNVHKEVIEHFARQVAIAFQKKSLVESVSNQKNILIGLQQSLQNIIESHPQNILQNAVWLTREAVGATEVIVVPIQKQKWKYEILIKDIIPLDISNSKKNLINALEKVSLQVYNEQKNIYCPNINFPINRININNYERRQVNNTSICSGLCVPFSSRDEKIGVMWIIFSKSFEEELSEEDKAIYQVYANQIALAYTSAKKSEVLKQKLSKSTSELTVNINHNYKDARKQANISFGISICTSIAGLILIFYGVSNLISNNNNHNSSQALTGGSGIATFVGVLLQAVTVLAFDRGKAANERMDRYHKELYNVRQLEILLSATEQLDPETSPKIKQQIIQTATNKWIESVSESNLNYSKSKEGKSQIKND